MSRRTRPNLRRAIFALGLLVSLGSVLAASIPGDENVALAQRRAAGPGGGRQGSAPTPPAPPDDPLTPRAQGASGLYFTGPYVQVRGAAHMIDLLQRSRLDTAVIDLKDAQARVHHDSAIPELQSLETGMLGDTRQLISQLHAANIHTVARIVCFNDPVLPTQQVDRAILDVRAHRRGIDRPWTSWGTGGTWLNPWDTRNHDMVVALAREAEALGFDEIQLDYIRFPVDDGIPFAFYPHEREEVRRRESVVGMKGLFRRARLDGISFPRSSCYGTGT